MHDEPPTRRLGGGLLARIEEDRWRPGSWTLVVDGTPQSEVDLEDPTQLAFEYVQRMGNVIDLLGEPGAPITAVHLGAGALTLPRYIHATRPGSRQQVVEIERDLVDFVREHLPFPRGADIRVRYGDAREKLGNLPGSLAGSLDLVEFIVPSDAPAIRADRRLKLVVGDGLAYTGINFNINNGAQADNPLGRSALVRQAFEAAVDREALIQVVYDRLFEATAQANPRSSPMHVPEVKPPPRDLDRARALLRQAGVTLPVAVTLTVPNNPDIQQAAEVVQAMVAEAGFRLTVRSLEFASSLQAGYAGDFQAYMIGWSGRADPDGNTWQQLHSRGIFNYGRWNNPRADALLDQARVPTDPAERRAIYAQLWEVERADMPLLYLWNARNIVGMRRDDCNALPRQAIGHVSLPGRHGGAGDVRWRTPAPAPPAPPRCRMPR